MPIKEEPTQKYSTCRYQNEPYSNLESAADNSVSPPPPINHHPSPYEMGFSRMTEQIREPNEAISPTLNNLEVNECVEIYISGQVLRNLSHLTHKY